MVKGQSLHKVSIFYNNSLCYEQSKVDSKILIEEISLNMIEDRRNMIVNDSGLVLTKTFFIATEFVRNNKKLILPIQLKRVGIGSYSFD